MFKFFTDLFSATFDLTKEERRRSVRIASWAAVALVVIILAAAGATAGNVVAADDPIWEAVLQTRIALVRLPLAVVLVVIGAIIAVVIYQVLENSRLGDRVLGAFFVRAADPEESIGPVCGEDYPLPDGQNIVFAEPVSSRSSILAALFVACILGLLIGVLR